MLKMIVRDPLDDCIKNNIFVLKKFLVRCLTAFSVIWRVRSSNKEIHPILDVSVFYTFLKKGFNFRASKSILGHSSASDRLQNSLSDFPKATKYWTTDLYCCITIKFIL